MLHATPGGHRRRATDAFAAQGVAADRIDFVEGLPLDQYLARYHGIDIALDPFPYGGGTTSCDALFMGVPVVTFRGKTAVGRGGTSILSQIGATELIAETADQYVQIAIDLARDPTRRAAFRDSMRSRMASSALMNAETFARAMESQYSAIWKTWCGAKQNP